MKKNTSLLYFSCSALLITGACQKQKTAPQNEVQSSSLTKTQAAFTTLNWTSGTLYQGTNPSLQIVPNTALYPLSVSKSGSKIYKCNNSEIFSGNGWLMQNSRTDAARGGQSYPLTGTNAAYFFHINQSGSTKYFHLLVTNPNAAAITVSNKGSYYTNAEKPLNGIGTGPSYFVSKDWLNNTLRFTGAPSSLSQYQAKEIFKAQMNNGAMIDGRYEITTSANAYYYTVITSTGNLADAVNASQGGPAAGSFYTESTNTYGREAGIYATSAVTAENDLDIPNQASYIGFALNTSNKFASSLEDQTAAKLMTLTGASSKSYGNYGHKYSVTFHLHNNNSGSKTVKLYFASNSVNSSQSNATWNGAIKLNGTLKNIYTQLNAPRQQLSTWTIAPGLFNATIDFYVPGLITANQQLIFEVN